MLQSLLTCMGSKSKYIVNIVLSHWLLNVEKNLNNGWILRIKLSQYRLVHDIDIKSYLEDSLKILLHGNTNLNILNEY